MGREHVGTGASWNPFVAYHLHCPIRQNQIMNTGVSKKLVKRDGVIDVLSFIRI